MPLYKFVKEHLNQRIATMIEEPSNWKRDNKLSCKCEDCKSLGRFLEDAEKETWRFKAVEGRRMHIENVITNNYCDVDCKTLKQARPYSLVCSKNKASYLKRLKLHKDDLKNLSHFEKII